MGAATNWTIADCCIVAAYRYIRCNLSLVNQCDGARDSESFFDGHQRLVEILRQGGIAACGYMRRSNPESSSKSMSTYSAITSSSKARGGNVNLVMCSQYFLAPSYIDVMALKPMETLQSCRIANGHIRKLGAASLVCIAGRPIRAPKSEPSKPA